MTHPQVADRRGASEGSGEGDQRGPSSLKSAPPFEAQGKQDKHPRHGGQASSDAWLSAGAALAVGAAFLGLWFWLLPGWLGLKVAANDGDTSLWAGLWAGARWVAAIPSVLGFAVALRCMWDFGWTGRGTPAPMIPPQRLVVVGPYRYVRNPMYLGFAAGWSGLWILFGHANLASFRPTGLATIAGVAAAALGVHLFVVAYEEPTLRKKFGADYEEYCRNVRRWLPRMRAWR